MNLTSAFNQWASRPADERFSSIQDLLALTRRFRDEAQEEIVPVQSLRVEAGFHGQAGDEKDLYLEIPGRAVGMTHYSFGQICQTAGAPAKYMRSLPHEIAALNLNHGLQKAAEEDRTPRHILLRRNGIERAHAVLSPNYGRIWNADVVERLQGLGSEWKVPPARPAFVGQPGARPATAADIVQASQGAGVLSIKEGDMIAPAGLYASDRDMFVFMVSDRAIEMPGMPPLFRGFFISNSEVGDKAFRVTTFLFSHVCGNHIVWQAQDVVDVKVVHLGDEERVAQSAFAKMEEGLDGYLHQSTESERARIEPLVLQVIGDSKEDTVEKIYAKSRRIPIRHLEAAYDEAAAHPEDGHRGPNTVWGMMQGLTRVSQQSPFAAERDRLDRLSGRLPQIRF